MDQTARIQTKNFTDCCGTSVFAQFFHRTFIDRRHTSELQSTTLAFPVLYSHSRHILLKTEYMQIALSDKHLQKPVFCLLNSQLKLFTGLQPQSLILAGIRWPWPRELSSLIKQQGKCQLLRWKRLLAVKQLPFNYRASGGWPHSFSFAELREQRVRNTGM